MIAGTSFAVDAFSYGDIVSHHFLTHFHADCYTGLKRSFNKPLIMSPITARLVKAFVGVDERNCRLVELHVPIVIDGVRITALDANHCPGSVMFLFELPSGANILHTGHFRVSNDMEQYSRLRNLNLQTVHLDTTYLSNRYAVFKPPLETIEDAHDMVSSFKVEHIRARVLIVCGAYLIGKEKFWAGLAARFQLKVWTHPRLRKALTTIGDPLQLELLDDDPKTAGLHVLPMGKVRFDTLLAHLRQFPDRYDTVIALKPSGGEMHSEPQQQGPITIVGVAFSDHCSCNELERFVRFLQPLEVISTVPYGASNQHRTPAVPRCWYRPQ